MDAGDLYRLWIDQLWNGDLDLVGDLVTGDFVGHWPDRTVRGVGQLTEVVAATRAMVEGLTFAVEIEPFGQGEWLAGRWRGKGTGPQGPVEFFGHDILRIRDGRFAEYWVATVTLP